MARWRHPGNYSLKRHQLTVRPGQLQLERDASAGNPCSKLFFALHRLRAGAHEPVLSRNYDVPFFFFFFRFFLLRWLDRGRETAARCRLIPGLLLLLLECKVEYNRTALLFVVEARKVVVN